MEGKNYSDLFDRFTRGELSASELKTFYYILDNTKQDDFSELYLNEWNQSDNFSNEYDANYSFERLKKDLRFLSQSKRDKSLFKRSLISFFKYAAVLFLGVSLFWLFIDRTSSSTVEKKTNQCSIKVAYGSKTLIQLPDGSVVHLNSGSTLKYPANFESSNRTVLLEGEGFFDVIKDSSRPFYVKTDKVTVKVLGTSFNVKSYHGENTTETTLVTGKVEIYRNEEAKLPHQLANLIAVLQPKQKVTIYKNHIVKEEKKVTHEIDKKVEPLASAIKIEDKIKTELFTDWKNNVLVFNNEKFVDIITTLDRWYNVEITMRNKGLENVRFSGKFDLESVSEVLDALSLIQPFTYDIRKNKITIN